MALECLCFTRQKKKKKKDVAQMAVKDETRGYDCRRAASDERLFFKWK